jgi:hypothetical protein
LARTLRFVEQAGHVVVSREPFSRGAAGSASVAVESEGEGGSGGSTWNFSLQCRHRTHCPLYFWLTFSPCKQPGQIAVKCEHVSFIVRLPFTSGVASRAAGAIVRPGPTHPSWDYARLTSDTLQLFSFGNEARRHPRRNTTPSRPMHEKAVRFRLNKHGVAATNRRAAKARRPAEAKIHL